MDWIACCSSRRCFSLASQRMDRGRPAVGPVRLLHSCHPQRRDHPPGAAGSQGSSTSRTAAHDANLCPLTSLATASNPTQDRQTAPRATSHGDRVLLEARAPNSIPLSFVRRRARTEVPSASDDAAAVETDVEESESSTEKSLAKKARSSFKAKCSVEGCTGFTQSKTEPRCSKHREKTAKFVAPVLANVSCCTCCAAVRRADATNADNCRFPASFP
jgi:hypothetical protein